MFDSQAQTNNETNLEIVLKMAMEPDLKLKFSTYSQFCVWKAGLQLMTQLLELPSNPLQVAFWLITMLNPANDKYSS